jgi:BirA family biotin operon repressor/biotin-[acetyl-CoA-carboxylase] ligase
MSVVLREWPALVPMVGALAVADVAGERAQIKWPNDVLLDGRKLAGVLAQAGGNGPAYVVVGIGLNVGWAPDDAARLGDGIDPAELLDALLRAYDALPADIVEQYRAALATLGQSVRVVLSDSEVVGRALDVLPDGRLVVLDDCGITHRFDTGDVVHLR